MSKHTGGNWGLRDDLTVRALEFENSFLMADYKGNIICDLKPSVGCYEKGYEGGFEDIGREHCIEEARANAQLIAAAPELLEVAKEYRDMLDCPDGVKHSGDLQDKLQDINRIIAKAEGDTDESA